MLSKRGDGGENGGGRRFAPLGDGGGIGGSGGGGGDGDGDGAPPSFFGVIQHAACKVAYGFGYSPEDTEDFCQAAQVYLLEKPHILEEFRGGDEDSCTLTGYLVGVLRNYALDLYRHLVGKWHSSAKAKRLGPEAEYLEGLRFRDRLEPELAISRLLAKFPGLSRQRALELEEQLKPRGLREWVGDGPLERLAASSHADDGLEQHELKILERRVQRALEEALAELPVDDRVMVRAIFGKGQSIKDFAQFQGIRQRQMYSRFDRVRAALRKRLESQGITAEDTIRIVGWSDSALQLDLGEGKSEFAESPAEPDDPLAVKRRQGG
jgi:RNA polymerase sigma factor (sigma-70 family)